MQKWEYLRVGYLYEANHRKWSVTQDDRLLEEVPKSVNLLATLGEQGWELINVVRFKDVGSHMSRFDQSIDYYFKRPKS